MHTPEASNAGDLSPAVVEALRARLAQQQRELLAEIAGERQQLRTHDAATSNTFVAGQEGAAASAADDEALALLSREAGNLRAVQNALHQIETGAYGCCAKCGEPIGLDRLMALPQAAFCVVCQTAQEANPSAGLQRLEA